MIKSQKVFLSSKKCVKSLSWACRDNVHFSYLAHFLEDGAEVEHSENKPPFNTNIKVILTYPIKLFYVSILVRIDLKSVA